MSATTAVGPASIERKVTWVELFFDLVFVAAVSQLGAPLARHYAPAELGRYAFLLLVTWWGWHGYVMYVTRFGRDDTADRLGSMVQMLAVIFMAANAEQGLDSESSAGFAAAYAAMRLVQAACFADAWRRGGGVVARDYAVGTTAAAVVWLGSAFLDVPGRYGCWAVAAVVDVVAARSVGHHAVRFPPHAAHLPERYGLFTLIWLGEAIVSVMRGIQGQPAWSVPAAATALSGVALVCGAWWAYFAWIPTTAHRHITCHADRRALEAWALAHVPLYLGLGLTSLGVEHAVKQGGWALLHGDEVGVVATGLLALGGALAALRTYSPRA